MQGLSTSFHPASTTIGRPLYAAFGATEWWATWNQLRSSTSDPINGKGANLFRVKSTSMHPNCWICGCVFFVGLVCWDGKFYCFLRRNLSSLLEITITHLQFLICFTHLSSKSPRLPMRCAFFLSLTREKKASIRNDIQNPYGIPWSTDCFVRIFVIAYNPYIITG